MSEDTALEDLRVAVAMVDGIRLPSDVTRSLEWVELDVVHCRAYALNSVSTASFNKARTSKYNLPPSLSKLPIIGNLHQLGLFPHRALQSFAQRHGPLMLLHLGSAPTVVVSSAEVAREIMKTHDLNFSSRPDSSIAKRLIYDHKDLAFAPYGKYWRQMRRICMLQLLSAKRVQSFRAVREEEIALVIKKIEYSCSSSSSSALVDLSEILISLMKDIVCRVAFGRKYNGGEGERNFKEMARELVALLGVFDVKDFIPSLAWVNCVNGLNTRVEKNFREIDCFLDEVIEDHINCGNRSVSDDGGRGEVGDDEKDLVDVLLGIQKDCTIDGPFDKDNIKDISKIGTLKGGSNGTYDGISFFEVVWEKKVGVGSLVFNHKLKTSKKSPWLMLYPRADATNGLSGGYHYDTRGMLNTISDAQHRKWKISYI
ncbi:hypothetical protein HHK36_023386 [Tetracentron sinense]|uniref:DUF7705 domain-containing protein n=1 Tax=Tetracentron sinense TaxID=13715 RepID=A0A834YT28_TETSI|nr:hypothetical protein HHK36_023386 [Tetracentron sinense]